MRKGVSTKSKEQNVSNQPKPLILVQYSGQGDKNSWMLLKRDLTKEGRAAKKVACHNSISRVWAEPAARFILPINWRPPPLLALLLVLSFLVIPRIGWICRGVVTLVTFIGSLTTIELHHRSAKVCVREFNKSGAASIAGARFILPINWEPPCDGYPPTRPVNHLSTQQSIHTSCLYPSTITNWPSPLSLNSVKVEASFKRSFQLESQKQIQKYIPVVNIYCVQYNIGRVFREDRSTRKINIASKFYYWTFR